MLGEKSLECIEDIALSPVLNIARESYVELAVQPEITEITAARPSFIYDITRHKYGGIIHVGHADSTIMTHRFSTPSLCP